jgi:hypothetical protein
LQNSVGAGVRLARRNLKIFGVGASEINVYIRGSLIVVMHDISTIVAQANRYPA